MELKVTLYSAADIDAKEENDLDELHDMLSQLTIASDRIRENKIVVMNRISALLVERATRQKIESMPSDEKARLKKILLGGAQ